MKKLRPLLFTLLLSSLLAGNIFAIGPILPGSPGASSLFSFALEQVMTFLRDSDCPTRQCGDCRPNTRDENGDCRPPSE
ncbi:MAG: hypothetical protein ACRD6X_19005 [Pyrinomonadaceae bacterium]